MDGCFSLSCLGSGLVWLWVDNMVDWWLVGKKSFFEIIFL